MNRVVLKLVGDYARHTLGVWVLVAIVQTLQDVAIWANRVDRVSLIGATIFGVAFFATFDAPYTVMRTLPLRRRDVALVRWWVGIGVPALFVGACIAAAWFSNASWGFPVPPAAQMWFQAFATLAALGWLSVLPLPMLTASRSNLPWFIAAWGVLIAGALYGIPVTLVPVPVVWALGIGGVALAIASFVRASFGKTVRLPVPPSMRWRGGWRPRVKPTRRPRLRGWPVLFVRLLRTTALLALVSVICATAFRRFLPAWEIALPMIFVSATGTAGAVLAGRWLYAVRAMQCLPVRDSSLALIVCVALIAPGLLTCLVAAAVQWLVPTWGVATPLYMVPVFAIVPALVVPWKGVETSHAVANSIQQWSPVLQLAMWPLWTGAFFSLALTKLLPTWFSALAVAITLAFVLAGYFAVWLRIRAGDSLERNAGPFAAS